MTDLKPSSERAEQREQEAWYAKTQYQILLFAGGIALFVFVGGWILDWYIEPKTSAQKKDLVQALGFITAGVAGAVGIYMTWRGQRQAREAQEENQRNTLAQLEQSRNELAINREGQITDRFAKAIEQLSATSNERKNLEMRLGGIHALERISRESENDYWPILEILAAYVQKHAPRDPSAEADLDDIDKGATRIDVLRKLSFRHADADIQAILDTIGRRSRTWPKEERRRIRLEGTDLCGAQFFTANLSGLWLPGADLRGAVFDGGNLEGTNFSQAKLKDTVFLDVDLQRTVGLTQDQIEQAFGFGTELPDHLSKPAHWDRENSDPA